MRFWWISTLPASNRFARGKIVENPDDQYLCPVCGALVPFTLDERAYPLKITVSTGTMPDFLFIPDPVYVVSERVLFTLMEKFPNLKIEYQQVVFVSGRGKNKGIENRGLKYYHIISRSMARLHADSRVVLRHKRDACGTEDWATEGSTIIGPDDPRYVDLSTWDGSAVFRCLETGASLYWVDEVKALAEKEKWTSISFEPIYGR
ncbi:MAG TPA: hypothetical protein GXX55_00295 [Firmicutes bacterium]|nr:hypothetical protein [Bacillota bacterium]